MTGSRQPRILVVDDDRILGEMISKILAFGGFEPAVVTTGEEAYQLALADPPQLLITDIVLPGIDGYTLCRRLREHPATRLLPIMALTAQRDLSDVIAGYTVALDDALSKPFQPLDLLTRVRALLERFQQASSQRPAVAGRTIAVLGARGGVGATTLAVNLAVLLQAQASATVALYDADLSIGEAGLYLGLLSSRGLVQAVELAPAQVDQALVAHACGLKALLGPRDHEEARQIGATQLVAVLAALRSSYEVVIVDCQSWYDERMLGLLAQADEILFVLSAESGALKNGRSFLLAAERLGIPGERLRLLLSRGAEGDLDLDLVERSLGRKVDELLPNGGRAVTISTNRGVPLAYEQPGHPLCRRLAQLAATLAGQGTQPTT